jgi:FkbM family methyltransferase
MQSNMRLASALQIIGENKNNRNILLEACKQIENETGYSKGNVREDVTGPIVDSLFNEDIIIRKKILNGLLFDFYYRTKIARDFILSTPEVPDHVWEPQTTKLLLHLSKNAKNVLVGGAYFGDQVVLLANEIKANGGIVHAFEPNKDQFGMLNHNAELNGLTNIKSWRMGLWKDSDSFLKLVGEDSFAYSELVDDSEQEGSGNVFPTVAIDRYMTEQDITKLDLIMLDIEGLEYPVLQGAVSQLNLPAGEAPNIVFEVHRSYVDWSNGLQNSEIVKFLTNYGYTVFAVRDYNSNENMKGMPVEIIAPEDTYLDGPPHGFNMLAVKDMSLLNDPIFQLCKGVSPKLLKHKDPALHQPLPVESLE